MYRRIISKTFTTVPTVNLDSISNIQITRQAKKFEKYNLWSRKK